MPQGFWNLSAAELVEAALKRNEAQLSANGALVAATGERTGRSPRDKFLVRDALTHERVDWGKVNQPFSAERFAALEERVRQHLAERETFVEDLYCGADERYRLSIRVVAEYAWHALFVKQLFVRPTSLAGYAPDFTILAAPEFVAVPERDGTASGTFIVTDFSRRVILIGGTKYAGEMKKSIFGVMNFLLPERDVLPMHCSANVGAGGDTALFFGLSGTGKTTLSADPERQLIGDDEHGWSRDGVFNFEGGCYAKCVNLSAAQEPQIYGAIRFGAVLENVILDDAREPDYRDTRLTENTRAAYPIENIANAKIPGVAGHAKNVLFLSADAFGVLPPIARLTPDQAAYYFLSGYTAKLAGTEAGLGKEPVPEFSTCFGAPFLPLAPSVYASMLIERLREHGAACWLVNTGWSGGGFGVGERMSLRVTRALVDAALGGALHDAELVIEPHFGLHIPASCPGVPSELLDPRKTWADTAEYDRAASQLAERFRQNFQRFNVSEQIKQAGPEGEK